MMTDQRPLHLLRRSPLRPGESLPSLVGRLARLNYYDPPRILERLILGNNRVRVGRLSQVSMFKKMAALTGIAPRELYAATAHRFDQTITSPGDHFKSLELPGGETVPLLAPGTANKHLRPESAAQFCPDCLKASAYHRAAWMPVAAAACLKHKRLLSARCPGCQEAVSIYTVVETRCDRCDADLTVLDPWLTDSIESDAFGLLSQHVIQAWLGIVSMPDSAQSCSLPNQSPAVLYQLLDWLRQSITADIKGAWSLSILSASLGADEAWVRWKYLHRIYGNGNWLPVLLREPRAPKRNPHSSPELLTPTASYCFSATAFKGIVDWPKGFHAFLQVYRLRNDVEIEDRLRSDFDFLYSELSKRHWRGTRFEFVRDAFNQYVAAHYAIPPSMTHSEERSSHRKGDLVSGQYANTTTITEAARLLNLTRKSIKRLIEVGLLFQYEFPVLRPERSRYKFLRQAEVMNLCDKWSEAVPLEDAARWMGLSEDEVVDLFEVGLLAAERGPDVEDGGEFWMFSKQAIEECLNKIERRLYDNPYNKVNLTVAEEMLSDAGLDAAAILKCVADGDLRAYHHWRQPLDLGALVFRESDIRKYVKAVQTEKDESLVETLRVESLQAESELGVA